MQMREEEGNYEIWAEGQRLVALFSSELQRGEKKQQEDAAWRNTKEI